MVRRFATGDVFFIFSLNILNLSRPRLINSAKIWKGPSWTLTAGNASVLSGVLLLEFVRCILLLFHLTVLFQNMKRFLEQKSTLVLQADLKI